MLELEFNKDKLKKLIDFSKKERQNLGKIINPIIEQCKSQKEQLELCQTAKMLNILDLPLSIVKKSESPDFILKNGDKIIGLEHQVIKNQKYVKLDGTRNLLILKTLEIFNHKYPNYKHFEVEYPKCPFLLVSITFFQNFEFLKKNELIIADQIADFLWCKVNKIECEQPNYISHIHISPHTKNSFYYKSDINITERLQLDNLIKAIQKKEKLVNKYRINSKTEIQWLLLTTGTLSSDSFEIEELQIDKFETSFDKIYLLDDFNSELHEIK